MVGTIGDITVFSFYVTKPIATGEGGMVTTGSEEYAKRIKIMRLHGIYKVCVGQIQSGYSIVVL